MKRFVPFVVLVFMMLLQGWAAAQDDNFTKLNKIATKNALRHLIRKIRLDTEKSMEQKRDEIKAIRDVIGDDDKLSAFYYRAITPNMPKMGDETPVADFFKWFIQYVVDNHETIIKIVKTIVELFAVNTHPYGYPHWVYGHV